LQWLAIANLAGSGLKPRERKKIMTRMLKINLVDLPNETGPALVADAELLPLVNAAIEADSEGWLWVPFADVPITAGEVRGIQRLNARTAAELVNSFHSWRGRLQRFFRGLPFYIGHPDSQVFKARHTDGRAYGWIKDLKAGAAALGVKVDWTNAGAELVNDKAFHWWSPFFKGRVAGTEGGITVYEPVVLQSAGFTNEPNWPGASLPNEQSDAGGAVPAALVENPNEEEKTVTLLERIKAALGREVNEDEAIGAVTELVNAAAAAGTATAELANARERITVVEAEVVELANARERLTVLETQAATATAELANARERVTALEAEVAAERGARAAELVNAAVIDGRVLPADAGVRKAALLAAPDFAAAVEELVNAKPVLKVAARTRDLGKRSTDQRTRQEKILELVNTRMAETKEDYDQAFSTIRRSADHAALFATEGE
jgi:hypothetical protein